VSQAVKSAITIDVDALRFYGAIHGLAPRDPDDDPIHRIALPRFFELLDEAGAAGTVFFVAEDAPRARAELEAGLSATASELASHSHAHDYRLGLRPRAEIEADLRRAHRVLSEVAGRPVVGFRAPGYNTTPAMLETLVELGYVYDSSLLPSPAYFLARAAAIARYAVGRRPSASLVGDPRAFAGPLGPYRTTPRAPWRRVASGPLVELPMAVEPMSRCPIIGTSWVLFPRRLADALLERSLSSGHPFVFEMHAIDLLDRSDPGIPTELAAAQPDLRRPAKEKLAAFRRLFSTLRSRTEVRPLRAWARGAAG
jgi:peptidoglycan/xylan/chitin deacetylase (PgdA/CDA1 family)